MKNIFLLLILILFSNYFLISNENNLRKETYIKRKILLLPFLNANNIEKYEYLSATLTETLNAKLLNTGLFVLADTSQLYNKINQPEYTKETILEKENAIKIANQYKSDVVVVGKYLIIDEEIMILISAMDIFNGETVASSSIKGSVGVDIFQLIDDISNDITDKMREKLPLVKKNYFDEMSKVIRKQYFLEQLNNLSILNKTGIALTAAGTVFFITGSTILLYDLFGQSQIVEYNLENQPKTKEGYAEYERSYNALIALLAVGVTSTVIGVAGLSVGIPFIFLKKNKNKLAFNIEINDQINFEICYKW